jgi:hypothetical protein
VSIKSGSVHRDVLNYQEIGRSVVIVSEVFSGTQTWAQVIIGRDSAELKLADLRDLAKMVTRVADRLEQEMGDGQEGPEYRKPYWEAS